MTQDGIGRIPISGGEVQVVGKTPLKYMSREWNKIRE